MEDNKNVESQNEEIDILTLTDEEGNEYEFEVIGDTEIDGNIYIAVIPAGAEADNEGIIEFSLLKQVEVADGEYEFVTLDDEEEFDKVSAVFDDMFDSEEDYDA